MLFQMFLSKLVLMLTFIMGVWSIPMIAERQIGTTAATKLAAIALIKEYNFQEWCETWLVDLKKLAKRGENGEIGVMEREVATPAVLALYSEDILTQACQDVLAGTS